ncbi:Rieske 2Fe-2S domain-containing protein [Aurantimonas sp. VKM B-3413]|uniref:Rieske (2Fe-2S) protein n=1 Tax=Aurantimonas sp. VKM B-3413 TaxID=2779401 RepID=UPI001E37E064|nr:Rieske 2Fe-2S domain-containing protein [Aurantimonas sp. VKM B-3413]
MSAGSSPSGAAGEGAEDDSCGGDTLVWHPVLAADALPEGSLRGVTLGGLAVVLFREGGTVGAMQRACPHEGADLATGWCASGRLFCPRHKASFDARTGAVSSGWSFPPPRVFPVRLADGTVHVGLPKR